MSRYVVANWKSHKSLAEAGQWLSRFLKLYKPQAGVKVILAPAFPFLAPLQQMLAEAKSAVELASQDISAFPLGSYTGAVAAAMIQDLVGYSLVGHSERRRWFRETDQEVANKVHEALAVGITPIICVDQPYMRSQFAALADQEVKECLVGYGPVEAIGLDMSPAPERIQEAISQVHTLAPDSPILYGGAVHGENAADYMQIPGLSGLMVATASLDPEKFVDICQQVAAS